MRVLALSHQGPAFSVINRCYTVWVRTVNDSTACMDKNDIVENRIAFIDLLPLCIPLNLKNNTSNYFGVLFMQFPVL